MASPRNIHGVTPNFLSVTPPYCIRLIVPRLAGALQQHLPFTLLPLLLQQVNISTVGRSGKLQNMTRIARIEIT